MDFAELQVTEAFRRLFEGAGRLNVSADLQGVKHVLSHQVLHGLSTGSRSSGRAMP